MPTPFSTAPWPHHEPDELHAAQQVLASGKTNYWTGDEGRAFEREYAASLGREHAIALHNGTLAIELALVALGVGPGDEVITTPRTFIASASAAVMRGATPVLVDVDRDSGNLDLQAVAAAITPRTKAFVPVHLAGWPVDMPALMDLARAHGVAVIEDCAQAHGASIDDRPVGAYGDFAAFSFCQDKILTTGGEGGLLALDDDTTWRTAWAFKDHGKSYEAIYERQHPPGYRYVYDTFGTNWRMLEIQAAIGRLQLRKLPAWHQRRHAIGTRIDTALRDLPGLRVPLIPERLRHAYYRTYAYVRPEALRADWNRDRIIDAITTHGVPCYVGSASELYLERAFRDAGLSPTQRLPVAQELGETSLCFLCHHTLSDEHVERTIEVVTNVLHRATR